MKKIAIISLFIALFFETNAQITTDERPFGLSVDRKEVSYLTVGKELLPDMQKIEAEDRINDQQICPMASIFSFLQMIKGIK
jgi:hypothetical protein